MRPRDQAPGDADIYEASEDGRLRGRLRLDGTGAPFHVVTHSVRFVPRALGGGAVSEAC